MKMFTMLFLASILPVLSVNGENTHARAREIFFQAGRDPCLAGELRDITEQHPFGERILHAYRGAAYAMLAGCAKGPMKKLKLFNQGKQLIEEAIRLDPGDPEIRFIRFMVQDRAPAFLGYDNRDEDLPVLIRAFQGRTGNQLPPDFMGKMARAIGSSTYPDKEQIKTLEGFSNQ